MGLVRWQKTLLHLIWVTLSVAALGLVWFWITHGGERDLLTTGAMTDAHHQFELACETCHVSPVFSGATSAAKAMNKACRNCHDDELDDVEDSHSRSMFRNPRMAVYWEKIDARECTSCHAEHRPEITRPGEVTLATDFCVACHGEGEQDVRVARPSHAGLTFDTCTNCHNYHDNRALYADFLVRHADEPWLASVPVHRLSALNSAPSAEQMDITARAPATAFMNPSVLNDWGVSAHAAAGINCAACHAADLPQDASLDEIEAHWIEAPTFDACASCHRSEARTFALGRHGMRGHPGISPPREPSGSMLAELLSERLADWLLDAPHPKRMTVAEARLPMHARAAHASVDCASCHDVHSADTTFAATRACAGCHADAHTEAYFDSPHYALWQAEASGQAARGTGVSCATCHMAKRERRGDVLVSHNQSENLKPNQKMLRTVCLDCHGLGFSLDSLADDDLIAKNFAGQPQVHLESIDWAMQNEASEP